MSVAKPRDHFALGQSSTAAPTSADNKEPIRTASLVAAICRSSSKANKPINRLIVKPIPQRMATP